MKYRTTLILLGLLLLVGAYFVWVEQPSRLLTPEEQAALVEDAREGQPLFETEPPKPNEVASLTVTYKDGMDPIEITRQNKEWFQTQPIRFPLNGYSVDQILNDVTDLRYFEQFTPGSDGYPTLEQTGLDRPQVTLTLQAKSPETSSQPVIYFGRPSVSGRVYARVEGDPHVYLVRDDLRSALDRDRILDARRRSLDVPTAGQLKSVSLTLSGKPVSISKSDTQWSFDAPLAGRVNAEAVRKIAAAIRDATPAAFEADNPDDLTPFGLANPEFAFRLVANPPPDAQLGVSDDDFDSDSGSETHSGGTGAQEPPSTQPSASPETPAPQPAAAAPQPLTPQVNTLFIGAPTDLNKEHYYAAWTSGDEPITVVFTIPKADVEPLMVTVDNLRDPNLCDLGFPDVRELTILRQNMEPIQLIRDPDGWSFAAAPTPQGQTDASRASPPYDADDGLASTLLETITQTRAESYLPDFKPSAPPLATVRMRGIGRSDVQNIDLFPDADPKYLIALNAAETTGYRVTADPLQSLFAPVILLRDRAVLNLSPEEINQITIQTSDGWRYVFSRQSPVPPPEGAASQPASGAGAVPLGPWRLESADRFESAAFDAFLKAWLPLHAEAWLAQPPSDPSQDRATLTLTDSDGSIHQINIDVAGGRGFIEGQADWFELPAPMLADLTQEFRDRTVLNLKPQDIQSITLTDAASNEAITLQRNPAGQLVLTEPNEKFDATAITQLTDALSGLRVERYLDASSAPTTEPVATWQITTAAGQGHTLALFTQGDNPAGQMLFKVDGRWCVLAPETVAKLRPRKQPHPEPQPPGATSE